MDMRKGVVGLGLLGLTLSVGCTPFPRRSYSPQSTTVAVTPTGRYLALDADHDALVMMHPIRGDQQKVALPGTPGRMAFRGHYAVVTLPQQRSVAVVDSWKMEVVRVIKVGVDPVHVAFTGPMEVVVVLAGENALATINVEDGTVGRRVALGLKMPGAVAVSRDSVLVTDVVEGRVAVVNTGSGSVKHEDLPGAQSDQRATLAHGITWDGQSGSLLVAASQLGVGADGRPAFVTTAGTLPVYYGPKTPPGQALTTVEPDGSGATEPLRDVEVPTEPLSEPVAVALVDDGRAVAVLFRGSRRVVFWGRATPDQTRFAPCSTPTAYARVGHGADGMALTLDGDKLVVHNAADLTVTEVAVPAFAPAGVCGQPSKLDATTHKIANVTLPADVAAGRRMFHDATNMDLTRVGVTCAFCHVEGLADGRTWDAPGGLRNTPSLAGARDGVVGIATTTLPLHWSGEFATVNDMTGTVTNVMVGDGISERQAQQLAAYVDTIPARDTGAPDAPEDRTAVAHGEALFNDATVGCSGCHAGDHFTDNVSHTLGFQVTPFQTPVMHNLTRTAPYLHDGSIPTLEALVDTLVRTDRMGKGSHLSTTDLADLTAYLRTL